MGTIPIFSLITRKCTLWCFVYFKLTLRFLLTFCLYEPKLSRNKMIYSRGIKDFDNFYYSLPFVVAVVRRERGFTVLSLSSKYRYLLDSPRHPLLGFKCQWEAFLYQIKIELSSHIWPMSRRNYCGTIVITQLHHVHS